MIGFISKCILFYAFTAVFLNPLPCMGLTTDEQHTVKLCKKLSRGVVNVTSTAVALGSYLYPVPHKGSGSGFILDYLGHVLTNYHVISDTHSIEVILSDGCKWPARLVGTDSETDLAILELRAPQKELESLAPMQLAATKLSIGQKIFALGDPFGTGYTVSQGVISSLGRSISKPDGRVVHDVIQTDISINPGTSGGPLVDSSGRVIGINTLIFSPSKHIPGVGFAISFETIEWVASQLISKGCVTRTWLGANLQNVTPALARLLDFPVEKGAIVINVTHGGPAAKAGIKGSKKNLRLGNRLYPVGGDIIVAIDGEEVKSDSAAIRILLTKEPGEEVLVSIYRGDRLKRLKVRLGKKPSKLQR
ncbi:MAG: trypsin-like peptidase domain-containing protein [Deltaproteobacteria bacterium]|nr:trypsin-like peptidase domain-containing protein [Deltaproteobacteria bacterium]MBW2350090.1 trypsin-like peptidase domain-containing protein [Deltaproteobacteria bacterium]